MAGAESAIVFLPRFTTLFGIGPNTNVFTSAPLDTSRFSSVQFQVWRVGMGDSTFTVYFEESMDADKWVLGATTPAGYAINNDEARLFSYGFRLRWFRLRIELTGLNRFVTCWAEGLLR